MPRSPAGGGAANRWTAARRCVFGANGGLDWLAALRGKCAWVVTSMRRWLAGKGRGRGRCCRPAEGEAGFGIRAGEHGG